MKLLPALLLSAATVLLTRPAVAEDWKIDFLKNAGDWKVAFPPEMPAKVNVAPGAYEDKSALRIQVAEGMLEAWKGKVSFPAALPGPGNYVLSFFAKAEPADVRIELSVWGSLPDQPKNLGERRNFEILPEWQEFIYDFSVEAADPAVNITWGNLARGGRTIFLSNIRLKKVD